VSIKKNEVTAEAGDEDHSAVIKNDGATLKCVDAQATVSEDEASLQLNEDTGIKISEGNLKATVGGNAKIELTETSGEVSVGEKSIKVGSGAAATTSKSRPTKPTSRVICTSAAR